MRLLSVAGDASITKKKLRIGIIDIVAKGPTRALFARLMYANLASIMPQVVGAWCEAAAGQDVGYVRSTGTEDLRRIQPDEVNLLFVCAFTEATQLAYALSHYYRSKGAVTVIGGPHARCYPEDAQQHFDYVLGFTDRQLLQDVLADTSPHRPLGLRLQADRQPTCLPLRRYVEGESDVLPPFYHDMIRKELGSMWEWLPEEALSHNPYAYLSTQPSPQRFTSLV